MYNDYTPCLNTFLIVDHISFLASKNGIWECNHSIARRTQRSIRFYSNDGTKKLWMILSNAFDGFLCSYFWSNALFHLLNCIECWQESHHYVSVTSCYSCTDTIFGIRSTSWYWRITNSTEIIWNWNFSMLIFQRNFQIPTQEFCVLDHLQMFRLPYFHFYQLQSFQQCHDCQN